MIGALRMGLYGSLGVFGKGNRMKSIHRLAPFRRGSGGFLAWLPALETLG